MLLKFMKQTSTIFKAAFKKNLILFLAILSFSISQYVFANGDKSYTCKGRVTSENGNTVMSKLIKN